MMFTLPAVMEDLDLVDYSSDRLESSDIWEVPGGGLIEQMVDFPCLGQGVLGPACLEPVGLKDVSSPSALCARSASETVPVSHVKSSAHQIDAVFESSRRRGEGDFIARFLGSSDSDNRGGFEVVEGSVQDLNGEVGPFSLGKGLRGAFS